ncbi:hypothetical protein GBAR_LOCUS8407 [Geodia barretti]|uniref:Centrosomal protein of 19 kDa n=1 Tax=Geodia barretti TaxID=519541 RepID=A0AA35RLA7_GEOBA|nr:hypothetical protein GBAR_LOCUS8407 [Geodia barretti]
MCNKHQHVPLSREEGKKRRRSMPLRGISTSTNMEEFANELRNHPRHAEFFRAIPLKQLHSLLQKVKDGCADIETQHQTEKSGEKNKTDEPPTLQLLATSTGEVRAETQEIAALTLPPVYTPSQTGALLLDLPPLVPKQVVGNREDVPHMALDDLLGPLVEKRSSLYKQDVTAPQDSTDHRSKERSAPSLAPAFFTETNYSDDFSSPSSLSFKEVSTVDGGGSMQGSETEQQPHSSSLPLPDIVTADNYSEASGTNEQDLNKVSEQTLAQEKKKMDNLFETNQILSGGKDWEYDKQNNFEPPQMESGWDSESSSTQEF